MCQSILKDHAHSSHWLLDQRTLLNGFEETLLAGRNKVGGDVGANEVIPEFGWWVATILKSWLNVTNNTTKLTCSTTLLLVGIIVVPMLIITIIVIVVIIIIIMTNNKHRKNGSEVVF
jgi:hypothetical protein